MYKHHCSDGLRVIELYIFYIFVKSMIHVISANSHVLYIGLTPVDSRQQSHV